MYLYTGRGGFKVMERKEVERQAQARPYVRADGIRIALPKEGRVQLVWRTWTSLMLAQQDALLRKLQPEC